MTTHLHAPCDNCPFLKKGGIRQKRVCDYCNSEID